MGVLIRPRFGQPCFDCGEPVSTQRIQALQRNADLTLLPVGGAPAAGLTGRRFLKSDILCVEHGPAKRPGATVEPRR
jgi:hypothetical protein